MHSSSDDDDVENMKSRDSICSLGGFSTLRGLGGPLRVVAILADLRGSPRRLPRRKVGVEDCETIWVSRLVTFLQIATGEVNRIDHTRSLFWSSIVVVSAVAEAMKL